MTEPHDERVDVARTAACAGLEEDLADAARIQREGGDLAQEYPALARHLEECEWCRTTLAELMEEPDVLSEAEPHVDDVERYLVAALAEPERIVRVRAAKRLGSSRQVGPAALTALAAAAEDPDEEVRAAAREALTLLKPQAT